MAYSYALPSRRQVVAGGLASVLPAPARGQPAVRVLRAQPGDPGWGYDGRVPGPLLRVKRGEEVAVRLVNELTEPTTIHWHGVRLPNAMDGVPGLTQEAVAPGASFDYRFTPPDAGTFWYRPHSRAQQRRGLAGVLIVDEAEPVDVDRDLPLLVALRPGSDTLLVNGLPGFDLPVRTNERVRVRLINAADTHFVSLHVDGHAMTVVAIDGQAAEPFQALDGRVTLAPGNRVDIFIDATLEPGSIVPILLVSGKPLPGRLVYDSRPPARPSPRAEAILPPNPLPARIMDFRGAVRIDLPLDSPRGSAIAGAALFSVKRGRTVMLAIANRGPQPHVLHIHGHHVRLLDTLDDGWKPFWLDTVVCIARQTTRVAFVADSPGRWLLDGRTIGSETRSLAWFEVT